MAGQSVVKARLEEGHTTKKGPLSQGPQANAATSDEEKKGDGGWSEVVKKRTQRKTQPS